MARPRSPRPTDVETQILNVLWERGTATVRDVHDDLLKTKKTAYSSVATIMRIMLDKGTVKLVDVRRPQKFTATASKEQVGQKLLADIRDRIFGGSLVSMLRHAVSGKKTSAKELAEIKRLVDELD